MNHKGQILALFVLLLPLICIGVGLIIDTGVLYIEKRHIDNSVVDIVEYGVKKMDKVEETELYSLLQQNINNIIEYKIDIKENSIYVSVTTEKKSPFSFLFGKHRYQIKSSYMGSKENDNIKIVRK